jgi:hypothetical protein
VIESTIAGNSVGDSNPPEHGEGGGVYNFGESSVTRTLLKENTAVALGGGAFNRGTLTIEGSTFVGNESGGYGGAISNGNDDPFGGPPASLSLANTTLTGNKAAIGGGGISNGGTPSLASLQAINVTIAENSSPTASSIMRRDTDPLELTNSLLVSTAGANCSAPVQSSGHNFATDASCGLAALGDIVSGNSGVLPLADNGGATQTHSLTPSSPAIDSGDPTACPGIDQRGVMRPVDGNGDGISVCDIGAYESDVPTPSPAPTPASLPPTGGRASLPTSRQSSK